MELAIEKKHTQENSESKQGGWYTKAKLEQQEAYTKNLVSIMHVTRRSKVHDYEGFRMG